MKNVGEYYVKCSVSCNAGEYIFIANQDKLLKQSVSAVDSLHKFQSDGNNHFYIRICNFEKKGNKMFYGQSVGYIVPYITPEKSDFCYEIGNEIKENSDEVLLKIVSSNEKHWSISEKECIVPILKRHIETFSCSSSDVGFIQGAKHKIHTKTNHPIACLPRRIPLHFQGNVEKLVTDLQEKDIIEVANSAWNSPIVIVPKKDGSLRLCIDYRKLNSVCERPIYPIPDSRQLFDSLCGAKYFSALDLSMGYYQIEVDESDREKTAFTTRSGQYQFKRMPFGLSGAPATFQRALSGILREQNWVSCILYLDDILIFGDTLETHNKRLNEILQILTKAGVKLNPKKCQFLQKSVAYLGHIIDKDGIHTDPKKTEAIEKYPSPSSYKELHTFLGLCGYYRQFIKNYSQKTKYLYAHLNKGNNKSTGWHWNEHLNDEFNLLKQNMSSASFLIFPDPNGQFILDTDASHEAIGAVLSQQTSEGERVVAYASNILTKQETQYCTTRKELLAVHKYILKFKHYLAGKKFRVRTDHKALTWMLNWKKPNTTQYCSWIADLQNYEFDIEHRKGTNHVNADVLSRIPSCQQCNIPHKDPQRKRNVKCFTIDDHITEETEILKHLLKEKTKQKKDYKIPDDIFYSSAFQNLFQERKNMRIDSERLCIKKSGKWKIIPPTQDREKIVKNCHIEFCHLGTQKCTDKLKETYFWPGLEKDVTKSINSCTFCQERKPDHTKKASFLKLNSIAPFDVVSLDVTGPFRMTNQGFRYILGIIDNFSGFPALVPLKSIDANSVLNALVNSWTTLFGFPRTIHSDNAAIFHSQQFENFCSKFNIKQTFSAPYHPQSNGKIERLFKTIKPLLMLEQPDWSDRLQHVAMAIRFSKSASLGRSPNDFIFKVPLRDSVTCYVPQHCNVKTLLPNPFQCGDKVWVYQHNEGKFNGPYEVIDTVGSRIVKLQGKDGTVCTRSVRDLKKYFQVVEKNVDPTDTSVISAKPITQHNTTNAQSMRRYPLRSHRPPNRYGYMN